MSQHPVRRDARRRVDVPPLILGLVLAPVAVLAVWTSFGLTVAWGPVLVVAPIALIALGVLGLVLSRHPS